MKSEMPLGTTYTESLKPTSSRGIKSSFPYEEFQSDCVSANVLVMHKRPETSTYGNACS